MPIQKLRQFLDEHLVKYIVITHSKAYTSQGIAATAHISGNQLAKTVMLKKDGELCMAVLPASKQVNLSVFAKLTNSKDVSLASERDFRDIEAVRLFPWADDHRHRRHATHHGHLLRRLL